MDAAPSSGVDPSFAILHGLYWLCANLTAVGPLCLVVDDAHWADARSLRYLASAGRRSRSAVGTRSRWEGVAGESACRLRSQEARHDKRVRCGAGLRPCLEKHLAHGSRRDADAENLEFAFPGEVVMRFREACAAARGVARVPEYALSGRHVDRQRTRDPRGFKRQGGGHGANETAPGARCRLAHSVTEVNK